MLNRWNFLKTGFYEGMFTLSSRVVYVTLSSVGELGFGLEPARTVQRDKPPIVVVDPQDAGYPGGFAFISLYLASRR